jgi:hypothetical protein
MPNLARSAECLLAVPWPISKRHISAKKCLILLVGAPGFGRGPTCVLIWCRTALVLFQRAAERVFGAPPDPSSS